MGRMGDGMGWDVLQRQESDRMREAKYLLLGSGLN